MMTQRKKTEFRGKVALVTGGGSGIGRASAQAFAQRGAKVVIADVDASKGEGAARHIKQKFHGDVLFVEVDVSQDKDVERLIQQIIKTYGRLDYAHNNVGIPGERAKTADCSETNWDTVMNTNLKSVWLCMKYEIRHMCQRNFGVIVNTSSVYGLTASDRRIPAYVASKHAIIGLSRTAALEYAGNGVRINAICPGAVDTPFRHRLLGTNRKAEKQTKRRYPLGRIGKPEDVAEAVVWLCSDAAAFITGSVIVIDGGLTAQMIV
jgi:NAD(P)-dependent dehydrogenase (short-subunit alcohol dehydrogenase family)